MTAQSFRIGVRFRWQAGERDGTYEIKRLFEGQVRIENVLTEFEETVAVDELVRALFAEELRFVVTGRHVKGEYGTDSGTNLIYPTLDDCPPDLVAIARFRLECIEPLLTLSRPDRTRATFRTRADEMTKGLQESAARARVDDATGDVEDAPSKSVSVESLYRWERCYRRAGGDLRALIPATPQKARKGVPRLQSEILTIVDTVIEETYLKRENVTIDDLHREVDLRVEEENKRLPDEDKLKTPCSRTIGRRVDALDVGEVLAAKHGKRAAKRALTQYGVADTPSMPLERVEIDHTRSDLIVLDDADNLPLGRLTMTYCIDVATRYPLGYYLGFEPPSYLAVMECLYHAIWPKGDIRQQYGTAHDWLAYGVPATLVIDNGREFIGASLRDACSLLGTTLQRTPVRAPHFKGKIERAIGSVNTMLLHTLPGTTFSNTQQRGDYEAEKQACIYLSEIDKIMTIFLVDLYAERYHRGLKGVPARRWEAATHAGFIPRVPSSAADLRLLLGRVDHRGIHHYGIEFENLIYNCPELVSLRTLLKGQKAKIKFHPGDVSRLHIHDPFDDRYIEVPALTAEYAQGLSLWKHRMIVAAAKATGDKVDPKTLGRARRKIQEIVDAGRERKRTATRTHGARWDTSGKPTRLLKKRVTDNDETGEVMWEGEVIAVVDQEPFAPPPSDRAQALLGAIDGVGAGDTVEGWAVDDTLPPGRPGQPSL